MISIKFQISFVIFSRAYISFNCAKKKETIYELVILGKSHSKKIIIIKKEFRNCNINYLIKENKIKVYIGKVSNILSIKMLTNESLN